jgi:hypothetical protein
VLGYANSGSLYHAGKQLDLALLVCKEQNDLSEVGNGFPEPPGNHDERENKRLFIFRVP